MKRKQRRIAAALSIVIVAIPLAAFMPWSGTAEAERYSGEPTPIISPSPLLTLAPEPEEQEYIPDAAEVEALAKMLYGEARGIASDMEKAACVWCVLNRVDDPRFPDTVLEVLEALIRASVAILRRAPATISLLKFRVPRRFDDRKRTQEPPQPLHALRDCFKVCFAHIE